MIISAVSVILYGLLAITGGIIGYQKAGSKISLLSGAISGFLLIISGLLILQAQIWGLTLGVTVSGLLIIVFALRFVKTRKFMPAGLMSIFGFIVLVLMLNQLVSS